jgi:hypothetical protein
LTSRYWLVRKVAAIVGYYGGLRNVELRSIELGKVFESGENSFESDSSGHWFSFERGKQRGLPEVSVFCVPRRQDDWLPVSSSSERSSVDYDPASVIDQYLQHLELDLHLTRDTLKGAFFKSTHGKKGKFYRNTPMGKNILAKVGHEFAEELLLPHPHSFTGHCWRRSCGTNASDAGVNFTTLMAQLGWTTPKTAIGYVKKSRRTSFQMSMFLSNVQRQNKDMDGILAQLKPRFVGLPVEESHDKKKSSKVLKKAATKPVAIVPLVDETLVDRMSSHLASARESVPVFQTREAKAVSAEKSSVLRKINQHSSLKVSSSSVDGTELLVNQLGSGSGEESFLIGGGSGGEDHQEVVGVTDESNGARLVGAPQLDVEIDPRVASILNNIRNHGAINIHFHFAK